MIHPARRDHKARRCARTIYANHLSADERGQVSAYPLRPRLADVQPGRKLVGGHSRSLLMQRIRPGARTVVRACRHLGGPDDHHHQLIRAGKRNS
jgi:hypothetical protein